MGGLLARMEADVRSYAYMLPNAIRGIEAEGVRATIEKVSISRTF